jgi:hypothetical protein
MRLRLFIAIAGAVIAIGAAPAALAQSQPFDGTYKGSVECEQISRGAERLRTPLAMSVRTGRENATVIDVTRIAANRITHGSFARLSIQQTRGRRIGRV